MLTRIPATLLVCLAILLSIFFAATSSAATPDQSMELALRPDQPGSSPPSARSTDKPAGKRQNKSSTSVCARSRVGLPCADLQGKTGGFERFPGNAWAHVPRAQTESVGNERSGPVCTPQGQSSIRLLPLVLRGLVRMGIGPRHGLHRHPRAPGASGSRRIRCPLSVSTELGIALLRARF